MSAPAARQAATPAATQAPTRPSTYVAVWLVLLVLLALSLAGAYLNLGWLGTAFHLAVSITQAALVLTFSMHLRAAHPALRVCAVIGFFGIAIMIALSLSDVLTR